VGQCYSPATTYETASRLLLEVETDGIQTDTICLYGRQNPYVGGIERVENAAAL